MWVVGEASVQAECLLGPFALKAKCTVLATSSKDTDGYRLQKCLRRGSPLSFRSLLWGPCYLCAATKAVPLAPTPASAALRPREVLTLEVLCSQLIQVTV